MKCSSVKDVLITWESNIHSVQTGAGTPHTGPPTISPQHRWEKIKTLLLKLVSGIFYLDMVCWIVLPITLAVVSFLGSWAMYALALTYGHVCSLTNWDYNDSCMNASERCCSDINVPTISTSGKNAPENALFTATVNAGAFLFIIICVLHHAHILEKNSRQAPLSKAALNFGCVASIGAFIAGNCNPAYLMLPHYVGAAVSFLCLCFYSLLVTILTGRCRLSGMESIVFPVRVLLTIIQILVTVLYCIFFSYKKYVYQHLSALFEWTLSINLELFQLSFAFEFYHFSSSMLSVLLEKKDEEKSLIMS